MNCWPFGFVPTSDHLLSQLCIAPFMLHRTIQSTIRAFAPGSLSGQLRHLVIHPTHAAQTDSLISLAFVKRSCRGCLFGEGHSRRQLPQWRLSGSSYRKILRCLLASSDVGFASTWSHSYRDTRTTSMACSACHRLPGPIDDPDNASLSTHPRIPFAASVTLGVSHGRSFTRWTRSMMAPTEADAELVNQSIVGSTSSSLSSLRRPAAASSAASIRAACSK